MGGWELPSWFRGPKQRPGVEQAVDNSLPCLTSSHLTNIGIDSTHLIHFGSTGRTGAVYVTPMRLILR